MCVDEPEPTKSNPPAPLPCNDLREAFFRVIDASNLQVLNIMLTMDSADTAMPYERDPMASFLEDEIYQEVMNTPGSEADKLAKYISMGNKYLEKL